MWLSDKRNFDYYGASAVKPFDDREKCSKMMQTIAAFAHARAPLGT
jgi:hypothetical protein